MIELHIELGSLSLEKALYYAHLSKVKVAGFLCTDLSISNEKVKNLKQILNDLALIYDIEALLAFKIAHIPPALIPKYTDEMKAKGFDYICVHGENINEEIEQGTNLAAISANADILLNPGFVDKDLIKYAKEKNTFFEFNVNPYYSSANALLVDYSLKYDIPLIWGNTIQKEKDFIYSSKRIQHLNVCPNAKEQDLIKKLNQDTFNFVHKLNFK